MSLENNDEILNENKLPKTEEPAYTETIILSADEVLNDMEETEKAKDEETIVFTEAPEKKAKQPSKLAERGKRMAGDVLTFLKEHVHKEDFIPLLNNLKQPGQDPEFTIHSVITVYLLLLIMASVAFGGFFKGLLAELVLTAGMILVQFIDDSRSFFVIKAVENAAVKLEIAVILLFAAALFTASEKNYVQYTVCLGLFAVKYAASCCELSEHSYKGYLIPAVISAVLLVTGFLTGIL